MQQRLNVVFLLALLSVSLVVHVSSAQPVQQARVRRERELQQMEKKHWASLKVIDRMNPPMRSTPELTNADDKAAVVALYKATNGSNWVNSSNWMKGDPCTEPVWNGLYCNTINGEGRILEINLVYNQMVGPIPPELAKASMLQVLRLYDNQLNGKIPEEVLSMDSLQIFDASANYDISGMLPDQISMKNLTQFSAYINSIQGSLPSVWNTPKLQILELASNQLTGALPDSIGSLTKLQRLVLSRNSLTGTFPASYGNLAKLQQLWLFYNPFNSPSLPSSWSGMKSMQNVQLDMLTGELPSTIGSDWSDLVYFVLINGKLTGGFPTSLCDAKNLISLRIFNNSLKGEVPECLCDWRALQDIEISDNQFTGPIPDCIGDSSALQSVYFSRNNMSGEFPSSIGNLDKLQVLDISSNLFYGNIPSTIDSLQEVVGFAIAYNKFSTIDEGTGGFFNHVKNYECALYGNPWTCPLPSVIPKECAARCSKCNSGNNHDYCSVCIKSQDCGWCNEGRNCIEGRSGGPESEYRCSSQDWTFGTQTCP